jgi:hypothetical protein
VKIRDIFPVLGMHFETGRPSDCGGSAVTSRWNTEIESSVDPIGARDIFCNALRLRPSPQAQA